MTSLPLNHHFISIAISHQCRFSLCLITFVIDHPEVYVIQSSFVEVNGNSSFFVNFVN